MDIRGLRYFISAAECLNFTRAAKECFITQTAMSQNIANMESELGFQLFYRNNRNVELTAAGRDFYEQVKILVHNYDNSVKRSQNLASGGIGNITIAVASCIEALVFLPRFRYFKKHFPKISLTICMCTPSEMYEKLRHGACDIAVTWPYDMTEQPDISVQILTEFKASVACSAEHHLANNKFITLEQLSAERLALIDLHGMPSTYRAMCTDWKKLNIAPPSSLSFDRINSLEELLFVVELDNVIAMVPEYVKNNSKSNLAFLDLKMKNPPMFSVSACYLTDNPNPSLQTAVDTLRDNRIPLNY